MKKMFTNNTFSVISFRSYAINLPLRGLSPPDSDIVLFSDHSLDGITEFNHMYSSIQWSVHKAIIVLRHLTASFWFCDTKIWEFFEEF